MGDVGCFEIATGADTTKKSCDTGCGGGKDDCCLNLVPDSNPES